MLMRPARQFWHLVASSVLSLALTLPSFASSLGREKNFGTFMQTEVEPWFTGAKTGFIEGSPARGKPVRLFYRAFQQSSARANIVLVHGFGERSEKFAELAYDFYRAGLNVYIYDQRGFGLSSRLHTGNAGVYVDQFAAYAVDLKIFIEKVVQGDEGGPRLPLLVFAHSMGGAVSSLFTHLYPELPKALILSAPMHEPKLYGLPRWTAASLATLLDLMGWGTSYAFGQKASGQPVFEKAATRSWARWNHYVNFLQRPGLQGKPTGGATFHWVREALATTSSFRDPDFVKKIARPILIFQAEEDGWVDNQSQVAFCALAPECKLVQIPRSKHEIYRETDEVRASYLEKIYAFIDLEIGQRAGPK